MFLDNLETPSELISAYGLTSDNIIKKVKKL